jgi:EAL domain-containing protein (putative c-di-GMP-specific phosphodiesterase class I)/GGDEF domain-containing protein
MKFRKIKNEILSIFIISGIGLVLILTISYIAINNFIIEQKLQEARLVAHTLFYTGGYLSNVAPNVKLKSDKVDPFILTSAYCINQIALIIKKNENFIVRQVSDRYRNRSNRPDSNELEAIEYFKKNPDVKEYYKFYKDSNITNSKELQYYYPLKITKNCLKCHGPVEKIPKQLYKRIVKLYGKTAFDYKLGDIRGVIAVKVPLQQAQMATIDLFLKIVLFIVLIYFIGIYFFLKVNRKILKDIEKINLHFEKYFSRHIFKLLKGRLNYQEFEDMKQILNRSVKSIKEYQKETYFRFYYNPMTNLPNRKKLMNTLENDHSSAIILIDVDQFKELNFYYGEEVADKLIVEMAKRLYNNRLFHIKIDEFVILKESDSKEEIYDYTVKLLKKIEEPYYIDNNEIYIKTRAGISFSKKTFISAISALDATRILNKDIAFCSEAQAVRDKYKDHLIWLKKIRSALNDGRIKPFFQPIVNREGKIVKYEALVRLIEEDGKIISPFFFLNIAKRSRLYFEITKVVIKQSFSRFKNEEFEVSINLSIKDLADMEIREFILEQVREFPDKGRINFEVVEEEDIKDLKEAKEFLVVLKNEGCKISIDDFGSGYANFDYLLSLNADIVKVDGSLIKNILNDKHSEIIVNTIITFAKKANREIVAEYVENEEIFNKLKSMGIDYFQGYYFSAPLQNI